MVVRPVHSRAHKVTGACIDAGVLFVNVFLVDAFRHELSVRAQHEAAELGKDRHVPKACGGEDFLIFFADALADHLNIVWLFVGGIGDSDSA